ncbi:Organic hydroperoxide resistance transcriptional regulator [compost metagenome]
MVLVQLTEQGQALKEQAKRVPPCILGASGQSLERLQQLQAELLELRANLQQSL